MALISSDEDAALLEAGLLSRSLARRYRQAVAELLEPGTGREHLAGRLAEHDQAQQLLDELCRQAGLLPRDGDGELDDLRRLGDWVLGQLDQAAEQRLLRQFVAEEQNFLSELAKAEGGDQRAGALDSLLTQTRRFIEASDAYLG
ncbi:MAG: hypothetical protein LAT56_01090 [Wenzhouxiangella sp.]|nr:hypothetical protein [Wenzhouxiangella sp.]